MTVKEFIREYKTEKKFLKKHIVKSYMPYVEKKALINGIINASSYVEVAGKKIYKRDTPTMMFIFTLKLVESYTDIAIDVSNVHEEYDALLSSGAMDDILSNIPESEINILKGLLDMVRDDLEENTRSLVSLIETRLDSANYAFDALLKVLERPDIKDKITSIINVEKK